MFALIIAGEAIFLLPFILIRVFKPIIREVFLLSDSDIGEAQAIYGITAVISYFLGGITADKYQPRNLISLSLLCTAFGGVFLVFIPSLLSLKILYGFWGVSTILLFWAALIKATRQWGNENNQGLSFGLLDGGRGFFAATIALSGAGILTYFFPEKGIEISQLDKTRTLQYIIGTITFVVFITGIIILKILPKNEANSENTDKNFNFGKAISLLVKKRVIYQSIIIFCAYSAYKLTEVYGTYARDIWNYSLEEATYFAVFIQYLRPIAAIAFGWIADKFLPSKLLVPMFMVLILGSLLFGFIFTENQFTYQSFITFIFIAFGTYSLRGLYFAIIEETKTSLDRTGTLVGIISIIGFTPDIFMSLFNGYMLGKNPTIIEYQNLFSYFSIIPIVGLIASFLFRKSL